MKTVRVTLGAPDDFSSSLLRETTLASQPYGDDVIVTGFNTRERIAIIRWSWFHSSETVRRAIDVMVREHIGEYSCCQIILRDASKNAKEYLSTFPPRRYVIRLPREGTSTRSEILSIMGTTNFSIIEGTVCDALAFTDEVSEDDRALIRMMV